MNENELTDVQGERMSERELGDVNFRTSKRRQRRQTLLLFGLVFVVQTLSPSPQVGDSRLSAITAWQFMTHFNLHLEGYANVRHLTNRYDLVHHAGHLLPLYPWPTMLLAAPADLIFALVGHHPQLLSISNPNHTFYLEIPTASLLVAFTAVFIKNIVLGLPEPWNSRRVAFLSALTFAFATSAWSIGSRALWQNTASMFFLSATILAILHIDRSKRWPWLVGALLSLSYMTRPTNAIIVVMLLAWVAWRKRERLLAVLGGVVVLAVPFAIVSISQYGELLPPYYQPSRLGETGPLTFFNALAVNMVSPSRGFLIYDPILLLAVIGVVMRIRSGKLRDLDVIMVLAVVAQWITVAAYGSVGGATYGPRLMLDVVPFLIILSVPALAAFLNALTGSTPWWRSGMGLVVGAVLIWGLFINGTGAAFRDGYCWSAYPNTIDSHPSRVWDWSDPQFLRPYHDLADGRSIKSVVAGSCLAPTT